MADANSALLLSAERALQQQSYPEVVKCCKQVLKQDRRSYGAYVLLAKALQGTHHFPQALVALRKALELDDSALPAWLGLLDLHEEAGDLEKVVEACSAVKWISEGSGDTEHYLSCMKKLASTYTKIGRPEQALEAWQEIVNAPEIQTPEIKLEALCGMVDAQAMLLEGGTDAKVFKVDDLRKGLEENLQLTVKQPGVHVERHNELLLDLYLQAARESKENASHLRLLQQAYATILSTRGSSAFEVALIFCEEDDADSLFQTLDGPKGLERGASCFKSRHGRSFAHLFPSNGLAIATIASLSHGRADRKKMWCEKALRLDDTCVIGWQLLAEIQLEEGSYSSARDSVKKGFQALTSWRLKFGLRLLAKELRLHLILGQTHLATKNYEEALSVYQFVVEAAQELAVEEAQALTSTALEGRVKIALAQGNLDEAEEMLDTVLSVNNQSHWALAEQGWLAFQKGMLDKALHLLEQAVEICGDNSTYRRRLGLVYLETGERSGMERAVAQLVEAARLDPREADVFRYLGHYYRQIAGDTRRAARSYQKAIMLDPEDAEAGEALCDLLEQGGQFVLEGAICREASQHSPKAYWAWRRLGFIQVQAKQWSESVANLQHALRGYSSDGCLWEALGLAYQQLGMLTAALKAYDRVVTLGETSPVFALLQSGAILLELASYEQAITIFRSAIKKVPEHIVAQCGLASALLGRARECASIGACAWGATLLVEAAEVADCCTRAYGTVAACWKLLGDIEVAYTQILPCEGIEEAVRSAKCEDPSLQSASFFHKKVNSWHQHRITASRKAQHAYSRLLHLCPQQASGYADLAIAVELVAPFDQSRREDASAWSKAEKALLSGLCLDATDADLWFVLGVLAPHKALKQHAFIQALRVDAYHAATWAHLGQLYLWERDLELARQAFDRARSADPTLSLSWAGMAFVHGLSDTKEEMGKAFASCLYAAQLSPFTRSRAYAHSVPLDSGPFEQNVHVQLGLAKLAERTHQLHLAQVYAAVEQSVQRAPQNVEVLTLRGLICESRGSLSVAIKCFQLAQLVLQEALGENESILVDKSSMISLNLARVFCKAGRSVDAIQQYEKLAESGILLEEPRALRSYALAAWQAGQRDLGAAIAKQAVELSGGPDAMCMYCKMMYWLRGPMSVLEEIRRANLELFYNTNFSFTALALAVAADHKQSVTGILSRCNLLFEHERGPQAHLLLATGKQGKQGEEPMYSDPTDSLLKSLHSFPDSISIRAKLGQELIECSYGNYSNLALQSCNVLPPVTADQRALCSSLISALVACSACGATRPSSNFSSCASHADATTSARSRVVRWVHMEPWNKTAKLGLVHTLQQRQHPYTATLSIKRLTTIQLVAGSDHPNISSLLRVCASDAALQHGDIAGALHHAKAACLLNASSECQFTASFQLTRCYLATQNFQSLQMELQKCRQNVKPDDVLGLLKLSEMENWAGPQRRAQFSDLEQAMRLKGVSNRKLWTSLWHLGKAEGLLQAGDLLSAEKAAEKAVAIYPESATLHLFHGAICLTLSEFGGYTEHLNSAVHSLSRAFQCGPKTMPIAGALLAQAETAQANSCSRNTHKSVQPLRLAWTGWPAGSRPGELYYQMGLVAEQFKAQDGVHAPETLQSKQSWTQRALHTNPSCTHYWITLQQFHHL